MIVAIRPDPVLLIVICSVEARLVTSLRSVLILVIVVIHLVIPTGL